MLKKSILADIPKPDPLKMYKVKRLSVKTFVTIFRLLILISIGYVVIYPFMYMVTSAFRTGDSYYDPTITWLTTKVTMSNFTTVFKGMDYLNALKNTLVYEIVSAVIQLMSCAVAAYGFARFDFKEKKYLWIFLYLTILLPAQATMLPTYINYSHLDVFGILGKIYEATGTDLRISLINTPFVFYLPALFGVGLRSGIIIFIYIQFFKGLPKELEEAAWIDGCGPFKTFLSVVIPSSGVVFLTVTIFSVIWHWNEYFLSVLYFQTERPLAVALSNIGNELESRGLAYISAASPTSAACLLFIAPVLIMFILLQKKFIQSIDRVGIVG